VDQQGHVYISGRDSHDIHRLSPDGTLRDIVLSEHDGVDRPVGITFNNDFTKLFIISLPVLATADHSFDYTISC
jgi:sugar lactone lactonase YvrE